MSEPKVGDQIDFKVGDKVLRVEAIPYGNVKKILGIVMDMSLHADFADVPGLLDKYLDQVVPLLFKKANHEFLTKEWVENNLDIPTMRKIIETAIIVNGLKDFFDKAGKMPKVELKPNATSTIPLDPSGSTTSSALPTDGDPAK
jgi:hypothetical protein